MADVTVYFQGWNSSSQSWGGGPWGQNVALPGSVGGVGAVSVVAAANVPVIGLAGTASVGGVTVTANANVNFTGIAGTGAVGAVTVDAAANVPVTGLAATGSVGGVTVVATANVYPTGKMENNTKTYYPYLTFGF